MVIKMVIERYNKEIEFILNEIKSGNRGEIPKDIYINYFRFRKNFFKYIGVGELSNLYNYPQQVIEYIEQVSPFCFMELDYLSDFPETLTKFICLLGGKEEDREAICDMLKNTHIKNINMNDEYYQNQYESTYAQMNVNLTEILGTAVVLYQGSNLYEVLEKIDDKHIENYMWYLCINNIFNNKEKYDEIFSGIGLIADQDNNLFVTEGNHRIFSYLALLKIRNYLGLKDESINFQIEQTILKLKSNTDGMSSKHR